MKLNHIDIDNFRCFSSINMSFNNSVNVIIGNNSAGKTALLDAIAIGLGVISTEFPEVSGISFKKYDIRHVNNQEAPYTRIKLVTSDGLEWDRVKRRDKSKFTTQQLPELVGLKQLQKYLEVEVITPYYSDNIINFELPFFAYYGTGRAILDIPLRRTGFKQKFSRFDALSNSLHSTSRFKSAFIWFYNKENEEQRLQKEQRSFDVVLPELTAVRNAITSMFPDFHDPHIEVNPLRFMLKKGNEKFSVEELSDGYKTMLGLVIDLSSRMAQANAHLDDPLSSEAIILIDEIDLHLHPSWQQHILKDLTRTFPNTQFIVTTHSPHVVSSVNVEQLTVLENHKRKSVDYSYGLSIERILEDVMGLEHSRNADVQKMIDTLWNLIKQEQVGDVLFEQKEALERLVGTLDSEVIALNVQIARLKAKKAKGKC